MLPPCNLSMRNQAEKLKNELKFPTSPAFVSVYKMKKDIKLQGAQDFCSEKNIPFNSEEHNNYRLRQSRVQFKQFSQSVNKCFETARPTEFKTGTNMMKGRIDPKVVTKEYFDQRLYVPNVFEAGLKRKLKDDKK